ncbi:glycosyltransferase [Empedobacter sp. ULE_I140]
MRILQIIDSLPATSGGARFVVNLSKSLTNLGHEVEVLVVQGTESHFFTELKSNNIRIIDLGGKNLVYRFNPIYILKIAKYLDKYDVAHVHIFPTSYLVAFSSFLINKKSPIIFTEHNSYNRRAGHKIFNKLEKLVYSRFSHIVALSDQVKEFILNNFLTCTKKLSIIQNAINTDEIFDAIPLDRSVFGFKSYDFLLLMSARFTNQKNHKLLLKGMLELPDNVKLILAGDGGLKTEMEYFVEVNNLKERVLFLGNRSDIFSLMKMVDVNILCSNFEGLSLAALEAMASGKPFIASNVEGLDFVVKNKNLLFNNIVDELVETVTRLLTDKIWYEKASEISVQRSKDFDFIKMTEKYLDVYQKVINEKNQV